MGRTEIGPIGTGHTGLENGRMLHTGMEGRVFAFGNRQT